MKSRAFGLAILLLTSVAAPLAAQAIQGRVMDAGSGHAVQLARIAAVAADGQVLARTWSGRDGSFSLSVAPGVYRLLVGRAGYADRRSTELSLGAADTIRVELHLAARALRLQAITVRARAVPRRVRELDLSGTYRLPRTISSMAAADSATAAGERGKVLVRGSFAAPDECFHLQGSVSADARTIELTVEATPGRRLCTGSPTAILYESAVHGLAPATYRLRVIHSAPGLQEPRIVLDGDVTVR